MSELLNIYSSTTTTNWLIFDLGSLKKYQTILTSIITIFDKNTKALILYNSYRSVISTYSIREALLKWLEISLEMIDLAKIKS